MKQPLTLQKPLKPTAPPSPLVRGFIFCVAFAVPLLALWELTLGPSINLAVGCTVATCMLGGLFFWQSAPKGYISAAASGLMYAPVFAVLFGFFGDTMPFTLQDLLAPLNLA